MSEANNETQVAAAEPTDFDKDFEAFLGHSFDDLAADPAGEEPPAEGSTPPAPAPATPPAPEEVKTPPVNDTTPAAAPNADTPAGGNAADAVQPDPEAIDPADLAAMLGMGDAPAPQAPAAVEGTPAPAEPPASATPAEDEPFMPFTPTFKLDPRMMSALFESEDAETRHVALVGLLSNFGNTITQVVDQRVKEREAAFQARFEREYATKQAGNAILADFYGSNQDLMNYKPAVKKAFELVVKKRGANAPYTPEMREEVAKLARAALKASGINLAPPAATSSEPPAAAPPSKAPGNAFDASASRPAASGQPDNSPAAMVAELLEF